MAVALASFKISMLAMSLGLMSLKLPGNGTPSRMMYGSVPAVIERTPRIWMLGAAPGTLEPDVTVTPATAPWMACATLATGSRSSRSCGTEVTEPVTSARFWVP